MRRQITAAYRRLASPLGRWTLRNKLAEGMPPQFGEPLSFLLTGRLDREDQAALENVESIRSQVARRADRFVFEHTPSEHGLIRTVHALPDATRLSPRVEVRPSAWVAGTVSVSPEWGAFLYLCAKASRAATILELGSCIGISGCYLAAARSCKRLITIEGSPSLAALAQATLGQVSENCTVVNALFDDGLDQIVPTLNGGLDLAFIDGHHEKQATLHYFERLQPYLKPNSLVVFDDIRLYRGMWEAWQEICRWQGVAAALNAGRFGLCRWSGEPKPPQVYDFSPFTGLWTLGSARRVTPRRLPVLQP